MRLGQLARKLAIKPTEIKEYLEKQGVPFEGTSNHKVPDEYVDEIIQYFSPDIEEEAQEVEESILDESSPASAEDEKPTISDAIEVEDEVIVEPAPEAVVEEKDEEENVEEVVKEESEESSVDPIELEQKDEEPKEVVLTVQDILAEEESNSEEEGEEKKNELNTSAAKILIKAPKVNLPGLKVVGKIDIPEPVKKEEAEQAEESVSSEDTVKETPERRTSKPRPYQRKDGRNQNRNKRRPLTLEEKREREKRSAERKKKSEEKKKRELKKEHYLKQVKGTSTVKPKKAKKDKPVARKKVVKGPPPKTVFGKFWRWLNT